MVMDLLRTASRGGDPHAIRRALEAAARAANDRLWVARNVARLYREALADTAAARAILDDVSPLTCNEWRLVAAAWVELGDHEAATRCLERAAANARTAVDLCTIAMGYRDAGFADEGRLLVQGAEAIASRALDCWTVATTYDLFGQREQATALLDHALLDAFGVDELVTLAHALAAYDATPERLAGVLREGERRASTVRDWTELATAHHYLALDGDAPDRCAAAASQLATTPDHERAIAEIRCRGMGMPLLDDERPKLAPERLLHAGARSVGWDRDPAKLLGWLRARLPRSTIDGMTRPHEFFGNDDLVALLEIAKSGRIPYPLPAYLDVLRRAAGASGPEVDHLRRAFACTVVCLEDAAHAGSRDNDALLAMLLESCIRLGDGAVEGALALFAALADSYEATHATVHQAYMVLFAELGLVLAAIWLDPSDPRIAPTIERMIRDDRRHRDAARHRYSDFVVGFGSLGAGVGLWYSLAAQILVHPRYSQLAALLRAGSGGEP